MQWKTINGEKPRKGLTEIEILLKGMCNKKEIVGYSKKLYCFWKGKRNVEETGSLSSVLGCE